MRKRNWFRNLVRKRAARWAGRPTGAGAPLGKTYKDEYRRYREKGLCELADGKVTDAIDALGRAALFRPDDPAAHFDFGRALELAGKTEAARQAYLRALDLNPNLSEVKNALLTLPPLPPTREDFHVGQRLKADKPSMTFTVLEVRKGGFGTVYVVIEEEFKARWALKTFQARYLWSDEDRKRFEREALTWLMLDRHPNIVTAKALMLVEGFPCLWLDYAPYNLAQVIQRRPLSTELALSFALQFCDGMSYAHQKMGIVHRDIKPSNCLLTGAYIENYSQALPTLKVTDFGLARTFAEFQERSLGLSQLQPEIRSQFTTVAGTPQYMSPEQFSAGAMLDTQSDIYSFGVMFYEMLTKDLPPVGFLAHSHIAKCRASKNVPASLKKIILQCVQLDPRDRPSDFGELRNQLDAAHKQITGGPYPWGPNPKALEMNSSDWNDKGIGLRNLGHLEAACTCHMRAVELSPNDAVAWGNYGGSLYALGRFNNALSCFEHGLKIDSSEPNLWSNKGLVLEALNRPDEARTCYERALEIDPRNDGLWMNFAAHFADAGDLESAVNCYDRCLEINRRSFEIWSNKAIALYKLGRYEEALASCGEGIAINPRHHTLWHTRSIVFKRLGRFEEALIACNRGLEINESDPYLQKAQIALISNISK